MDEYQKQKLKDALPEKLKIFRSMEYPFDEIARIRGYYGQFAVTLEYHYNEDPDRIGIETVGIDSPGINAVVPLEDIESILETAS
jgi:hypothetical protein